MRISYGKPANLDSAIVAQVYKMEADLEGARLLTLKAAWMADNAKPNSLEASMSKVKAGRVANEITLSVLSYVLHWAIAKPNCWRSGRVILRY